VNVYVIGEALYCDDIPKFEGELYLALVLSTRAHSKIVNIDPSEALSLPGVVEFFSSKHNPPAYNNFGPVEHDDQVFATDKVC
jgi:xanthine dehydrogenase/oxidase